MKADSESLYSVTIPHVPGSRFASACNLLGLEVQDPDEGKSQIAHGETVRETANMISFMADVIGIRDDMYIGKGNAEHARSRICGQKDTKTGFFSRNQRLSTCSAISTIRHRQWPDMLHIIDEWRRGESERKGIAMSWAYSPSYGKPLSVPQGVIGLMNTFRNGRLKWHIREGI